ncbi:MAG: Fic family protein [Candidatus Daviesbacteria bacterium]
MFKPNFNVTPQILNDISQIAEIKAIIERSRVLPLNEAQLRRQAIFRMAHTSTSIEGNRLAQYEVDKVLSGMSVNADAKSIQEVKNYQKALQEIEKMAQSKKVLTLEDILSLHKILMENLIEKSKWGHFRPGSIYVIDDLGDGREKLRYEGPPAEKVPFLLNELLKWLSLAKKEGLHPILRAGIFHAKFVFIHPFADGNGRMARLLTTKILYQEDWDFRKIIVLEDFYNRDRQAYYNALTIVSGKHFQTNNDFTSWLEYFTTGFISEAKKVIEAIQTAGFGKASEKEEQIFLDRDELKIVDFISTTGKTTSTDVQEILGIAKRTAQLKLKNLLKKGMIETRGNGPSTYYILAQ